MEARVGVFVLAALAVLVGFVVVLGDVSFSPGFRLYADFGFTGGLQTGAPVQVSGVKVGRITHLQLLSSESVPAPALVRNALGQDQKPLVRATLMLEPEAKPLLTDKAIFSVGTQGVIGETYLELSPAQSVASDDTPTPLVEHSVVRGVDAPRLHLVTLQLAELIHLVDGFLGATHRAPFDEVGQGLGSLLRTINGVLGSHGDALSGAVGDMTHAVADLRVILTTVRNVLGDGSDLTAVMRDGRSSLAALRTSLPAVLTEAETSLRDVHALITRADGVLDENALRDTLNNAQQAVAQMHKAAIEARQLLSKVHAGQGTMGGLLTDAQIYDDMKELLRDLKNHPWKLFWRD